LSSVLLARDIIDYIMAGTGEIAGFAADGGDPRIDFESVENSIPLGLSHKLLHDPSVLFEEYRYFAEKTRAEEEVAFATDPPSVGLMQVLFPTKSDGGVKQRPLPTSQQRTGERVNEKHSSDKEASGNDSELERMNISDIEWTNASRATRTATASACFYLITTDILGPFGVGYSLGTLGWGPGIALFTVFGGMAG